MPLSEARMFAVMVLYRGATRPPQNTHCHCKLSGQARELKQTAPFRDKTTRPAVKYSPFMVHSWWCSLGMPCTGKWAHGFLHAPGLSVYRFFNISDFLVSCLLRCLWLLGGFFDVSELLVSLCFGIFLQGDRFWFD